ncbi:MAG: DUF4864 domain-containing protein [Pseudomonadota bacterium]
MNRLIFSAIFAFGLAGWGHAQDARDTAIQNTIQDQIEAFKADDFGAAFSYASPMIQGMFRTPENFGVMVQRGYPMVWRPNSVRYLELDEKGGRLFQKVMITDQNGGLHMLEYQMIQVNGAWQINGVQLLPQPDLGA